MRQIGIASINYANDNAGSLPLRYDGDRGPLATYPYNNYNFTFYTWDETVTIPAGIATINNVPIVHPTYGIGLLYSLGYLHDPRVFYCPSQRDNGFNFGAYTQPFFSVPTQDYYVSYMFNPHHTDLSDPNQPNTDVLYHKLSQMRSTVPSNLNPTATGITDFTGCRPVLALEQIKSIQWTAHTDTAHPGTPVFNLLYADGHVASVASKATWQTLMGFWATNQGGLASSGWQRFDRVLKQLEADSNGQ